MFRSAVVCTDTSPASDQLISVVPRLCQFGIDRIVLACVTGAAIGPAEENALMKRLAAQRDALETSGLAVEFELERGPVSLAIDQIADRAKADVVVVGIEGYGRDAQVIFPGLDDETSAHLAHPLLSLRVSKTASGAVHLLRHTPMLSKVLLAVDFTAASLGAIEAVETMIEKELLSEVSLLHVCEGANASTAERVALRAVADRLRHAGSARVLEEFGHGDVAEAIMNRAHAGDVTLTITGSRGHGLYAGLMMGSVGAAVVRHLQGPLLSMQSARPSQAEQLTA